jgi:hypothetical protein
MTIRSSAAALRHTGPRTGHAYRVPIVREAPPRPVNTLGEDTW